MTDRLSKEQRSACMSKIRGRNTKPEIKLRKALWHIGFRYGLKSKLIGKPDIKLTRYKVAVFVDGCYWHGCPEHGRIPQSNVEYWESKLARNKERDIEVTKALSDKGWNVVRFWEHEIKNDLPKVVHRVVVACEHL